MQNIAVIGGGITGVTTAYALTKRGFNVTLLDRHRYSAMETSFANGGQLSASNAEVWNHWPTILKGLKWMLRADAPLLVNPKPSWHKLAGLPNSSRLSVSMQITQHKRQRSRLPRASISTAGRRPKALILTWSVAAFCTSTVTRPDLSMPHG